MKKILFFLLLLFCIPFTSFAINGDGSFATPYNGPLTANMTWSGTVYVNGDVTVDGYTLTISPGAIIVFLIPGSDLIITGTGILTADGTSGSMIRFTADSDNSGTFGGSGETWGHISFQNMTPGFTTPSIIDNCIIEFGQKNSSPPNFESAGGGIQTAYTYLTISNSIIRNNYAGWGGGIYVNANSSPAISNCKISNNIAGTTGGGMSIYQYSAAVVTNCIIEKNTCNGGGSGGGIFIGDYPDNVRLFNCTIASNSSTSGAINIRIWKSAPSSGPQFFNTIAWGSANSINYYQIGPSATDFNYCAIQGYTSGYTSCINISGTNVDPTGPNFLDPVNSDYSIKYISPCREAGTSSGAAATDYLGKSRIYNYDIGAYEVQYSRWKTTASSTDWNTAANWEAGVDPATGTGDVYIPSGLTNYPTGSASQNFTIGSGKFMTLEPGAQATLGTLTNNGTLSLQSSATGISSLIASTFSGNNASIELYLTGGGTITTYSWHYISTPVSSLPVSTFAPGTTLDVAQWIESRPTFSLREGWVAYDGYIYSTGEMGGPTFANLTPGKGYNYWDNLNNKFTFPGQLNTTDAAMALGFSGDATLHGFNLLGNPFSSGLNWDDIINNVYFTYPSNTSKSLYFTRDNVQCSYISGVGIPGDVTAIIPPMQGFFNKTYSTGNTITLPAAARVQGNIHPRYKGSAIIPLVRLSLAEGKLSDETVVRFDAAAKSDLDYDFDAIKMFLASDIVSIYSSSPGTKYAINGLPFPETFVEIPVVVNLTKDTIHTISTTQLQGLDSYNVTLTDNITAFTADLKTTPVLTFSAAAGTIADRFILKVSTIATGTENPVAPKNIFNIYPSDRMINIQTIADEWDAKSGSVKVLDLTGKTVSDMNDAGFSRNSIVQVPATGLKGMYVVEIRSGAKRYVGKVVIR